MKDLTSNPTVQTAVAEARTAQQKFQSVATQFDDLLNYNRKLDRLKEALNSAETLEQVEAGRVALAEWDNEAAKYASRAAQRIVGNAAHPFKLTVLALLDTVDTAIEQAQVKADQLESDLSKQAGTAVKTDIKATLHTASRRVRQQRRAISAPNGTKNAANNLWDEVIRAWSE